MCLETPYSVFQEIRVSQDVLRNVALAGIVHRNDQLPNPLSQSMENKIKVWASLLFLFIENVSFRDTGLSFNYIWREPNSKQSELSFEYERAL